MNRKLKLKLSFEEDEDQDEVIDVKKTLKKEEKTRKIKQNDVKLFTVESNQSIISSGQYDTESLNALKQAQKFSSEAIIRSEVNRLEDDDVMVVEEVILNGEEAELLEKAEETPLELTKEEKILKQHIEEKSQKRKERLLFKGLDDDLDNRRSKDVDLDQPLLETPWEEDVMKRGGVTIPRERSTVDTFFSVNNAFSKDFTLTDIGEVIEQVQSAKTKLKASTEEDEREIERIKVEINSVKEQMESLKTSSVEKKVEMEGKTSE